MTRVEEMDKSFAKFVKLSYYAGLILMFVSAALYFLGINQSLPPQTIMERWNEPTTLFWKDLDTLVNYGFMRNIHYSDSIILLAVSFIALTPLVGLVLAIGKARPIYKILLVVLVIELIVAVLQPVYLKF